jgi:hypothetical protein
MNDFSFNRKIKFDTSGNPIINANILPSTTLVYDLGSPNKRWRDIYLSGNTIDLGGTKIQKEIGGGIKIADASGNTLDGKFNNIDISGNATINGIINQVTRLDVSGSILPTRNLVYDLGAPDKRWNDLYLSGNTIDLSGTLLSRHTDGSLMVHDSNSNMVNLRANNIIADGNLTVSGTTTTINSTTVTVQDPIITLGSDVTNTKDKGIEFKYGASKIGFFGYDDSTGNLTFLKDASNNSEVFSGSQGTIEGLTFKSTVASGTAPLTISSSTVVSNLNADLLDGLDSTKFMRTDTNTSTTGNMFVSGNVGIGITNPAKQLDVSGNINFTGYLYNNNTILKMEELAMNDTRSVNITPVDLPVSFRADFKINTTNGLSDTGTYNVVLSLKHLSGIVNQMGLTENNNLWLRSGGNTTWNAWKRVMDTNGGDFTNNIRVGNANGYSVIAGPVVGTGYYTYMSIGGGTGGYCYWFKNDANRTADGGIRTATLRNDDGELRLLSSGSTGIRIAGGICYHENGNSSYSIYGPNTTYGAYLRVGTLNTVVDSVTANVISSNGNLHLDSGSGKSIYANLYGGGTVLKPGGGSWGDSSDLRIKKDIIDIPNALDKLTSLRGVQFKWIHPEHHQQQGDIQYGFIAQEFEKVFPQSVRQITSLNNEEKELCPDGVKTLGINFDFHAYTIEAIRELYLEHVKPLQEENKILKAEIELIKTRLNNAGIL